MGMSSHNVLPFTPRVPSTGVRAARRPRAADVIALHPQGWLDRHGYVLVLCWMVLFVLCAAVAFVALVAFHSGRQSLDDAFAAWPSYWPSWW
jgi:hypothetical protein